MKILEIMQDRQIGRMRRIWLAEIQGVQLYNKQGLC